MENYHSITKAPHIKTYELIRPLTGGQRRADKLQAILGEQEKIRKDFEEERQKRLAETEAERQEAFRLDDEERKKRVEEGE